MFDPKKFIEEAIEEIKQQIKDRRAIIALSGGVDSSVAAVLTHKAIGDKLTAVFVDTGLMRKGEREEVEKTFRDKLGLNLIVVDAKDRFLEALKGVTDPEEKRKIIGKLFIDVFEEIAEEMYGVRIILFYLFVLLPGKSLCWIFITVITLCFRPQLNN